MVEALRRKFERRVTLSGSRGRCSLTEKENMSRGEAKTITVAPILVPPGGGSYLVAARAARARVGQVKQLCCNAGEEWG